MFCSLYIFPIHCPDRDKSLVKRKTQKYIMSCKDKTIYTRSYQVCKGKTV